MATTSLVFQFTFSGNTYTVAMAAGVSGWVLISNLLAGTDAVVINAAITYVSGLGGGLVVLLGFRFDLATPILCLSYVSLQGVGGAVFIPGGRGTVLHPTNNNDAINLNNAWGLFIRDLMIDGDSETNTAGRGIDITYTAAPPTEDSNLYFENIYIYDTEDEGFYGTGDIREVIFVNVVCNAIKNNGFDLEAITDIKAFGLVAGSCENFGIMAGAGSQYTACKTFANGSVANDGWAVRTSNSIFTNCIAQDEPQHGWNINNDNGEGHQNQFIGCRAERNGTSFGVGFNIYDVNGNQFVGCYAYNDTPDAPTQFAGYSVDGSSARTQFSGCYANRHDDSGWLIDSTASYTQLDGCYAYGNGAYGVNIVAAACVATSVFGLKGQGNTSGLINDDGTDTMLPSREWLVTYGAGGISLTGDVPLAPITNGQSAAVGFECPPNLQQLVRATLKILPNATQAAANWDIFTDYGGVGEAPNAHSEQDVASTYNVTNNQWYDIILPLGTFFLNLAVGDRGGVRLLISAAGHNASLFSLLFEYV